MGFPISTIAVDSGLSWEQNLNAALVVIDQHNHSPGFGQQIQPNGINISSDLSFQNNNATSLRAARFTPQVSPIPNTGLDVGELYVSGNELYYNDVTGGHQVQLTASGTVNATSSGISSGTASASFSAGVLVVKSSSTSYANIAAQSVLLSNSGVLSNQLTLQAPTLSSSYSITLPPIPGASSFVTLDTSGNLSGSIPISGGLTTGNLSASAGIVGTQLDSSANILGSQLSATAGVIPSQNTSLGNGFTAVSSSSGTFSTTSGSFTAVISQNYSATTSRPVFVNFSGDQTTSGCGAITINNPSGGNFSATFLLRQSNGLTVNNINQITLGVNSGGNTISFPAGSLNFIDINPDPTHPNYQLQVRLNSGTSVQVTGIIMTLVQV